MADDDKKKTKTTWEKGADRAFGPQRKSEEEDKPSWKKGADRAFGRKKR